MYMYASTGDVYKTAGQVTFNNGDKQDTSNTVRNHYLAIVHDMSHCLLASAIVVRRILCVLNKCILGY